MIKIGNIDFTEEKYIIDILHSSGVIKARYCMGDDAKHNKYLMKDNYIEFSFELDTFVSFVRGDYIILNGIKYTIREDVDPEEVNIYHFKYTLKFEGVEMFFQDIQYYYMRQGLKEAEWSLTSNPASFFQVGVDNINRYFGGTSFNVGTIEPEELITLSFGTDANIFDAFTQVAQECNAEWYLTGNTLHLVKKVSYGSEIDFESDVSVTKMDRSEGEGTRKYNRIVALGSTRNIPANYRETENGEGVDAIYQKRLRIPIDKGDVINAKNNMKPEEVIEGTVIFDEVYPKRIGTISEVTEERGNYEDEDGNPTGETYPIFTFKDNGLPNFKESYLIPGEELKLHFSSGNLNGRDFALQFKSGDDTGSSFEIQRSDEYGAFLPNEILKPEIGDEYILYGFDIALVGDQYVPAGELELYDTAVEWMENNLKDKDVYGCPTVIKHFADNEMDLEVGQKVKLIHPRFENGSRSSRIMGFEKKLIDPYEATYTVGDNAAYSRLKAIEDSIKELQYAGNIYQSTGQSGVYLIKQFDNTPASDFNAYSAKASDFRFLNRLTGGTVKEEVTFEKKITSKELTVGEYIPGMVGGKGAHIDSDGKGEMTSLVLRDSLVVPKITFNTIEVVSGDLASSFAYGTILSVDTENKIATLDLLDGELGTLQLLDICRGVFHNLEGGNEAQDGYDDNGFLSFSGFSTSYFTPTQILENAAGVFKFKYELKDAGTPHPIPNMKFYAYGNFENTDRQAITYQNRYYTRIIKNVNTWVISTRNIAYQNGLLEGLTINGTDLHGYGTFGDNNYFTNTTVQIDPEQIEGLKPNIYRLRPSTTSVKASDGSFTPAKFWCDLLLTTGDSTMEIGLPSRFTLQCTYVNEYGETTFNYPPGDMLNAFDWKSFVITLKKDGTVMDTVSIPVLHDGTDGLPGTPGTDGSPGTSSYIHRRYSINANGNPMQTSVARYIGIAITSSSTAPTSYTAYTWSLWEGTDGQTGYVHIKYSNDGGKTFTGNNGKDTGDWIGQYVSFSSVAPLDPLLYTWTHIKGADSVSVNLSKETISFKADAAGNVSDISSAFTQVTVCEGDKEVVPFNRTGKDNLLVSSGVWDSISEAQKYWGYLPVGIGLIKENGKSFLHTKNAVNAFSPTFFVEVGKQYTLSFLAKNYGSGNGKITIAVRSAYAISSDWAYLLSDTTFDITTSPKRLSVSFIVPYGYNTQRPCMVIISRSASEEHLIGDIMISEGTNTIYSTHSNDVVGTISNVGCYAEKDVTMGGNWYINQSQDNSTLGRDGDYTTWMLDSPRNPSGWCELTLPLTGKFDMDKEYIIEFVAKSSQATTWQSYIANGNGTNVVYSKYFMLTTSDVMVFVKFRPIQNNEEQYLKIDCQDRSVLVDFYIKYAKVYPVGQVTIKDMPSTQGHVNIPVRYNDFRIDKTFSFSKSIAGATGRANAS